MDDVMVLGRGSTWTPVPCDEWTYEDPGGEGHRQFRAAPVTVPDTEGWARLAKAISAACPLAQAAVGPILWGGPEEGVGERLPGIVLVALDRNPDFLETAYHEAFHELWDMLDEFSDEQDILAGYGVGVRKSYTEQGLDEAHLVKLKEGAAVAFARWAVGHPHVVTPCPRVLALWQAMKCGEVGTREGGSLCTRDTLG